MAQHESYQGLARKWRPQRFEDLVGQEAMTQSVQNALRQGRVAHAHLLTGPRGIGKTTSARIIARALNCVEGPTPHPCGACRHCIDIAAGADLDVIEIDAASNTGVDQMRDLLERVVQAPFSARHKVYIIDEVHMLSIASFNALLKTLEEPPPHVIFIFATTEFEKVPETVRSRCQVHPLRRLTADDIILRLTQVAQGEGIELDPAEAKAIFGLIARSVEGGMRDALVIFDQLIALSDGRPTAEAAIRLLGLADQSALTHATDWLAEGNAAELLRLIEDLVNRGRSLERFVKGLIAYQRDLMLLQAGADEKLVALTGDALKAAREQARRIATPTLYNLLNQLFELEEKLKTSTQARFLVEFTFLRLASIKPVVPIDDVIKRLAALPDNGLAAGASPEPPLARATSRATDHPARPTEVATQAKDRPLSAALHAPAASHVPRPMVAEQKGTGESALLALANSVRQPIAAALAGGVGSPVMFDSAPPGVDAPPTHAGETRDSPITGLGHAELIQYVLDHSPDSCRSIFARYLKATVDSRVVGATLQLDWPRSAEYQRGFFEKPDNFRAFESTLSELCGFPMRVQCRSVDADSPAVPPVQAPPPQRAAQPAAEQKIPTATATTGRPTPRPSRPGAFGDSAPLMDGPNGQDGYEIDDGMPFEAPERPAREINNAEEYTPAVAPKAEPVDSRSAVERAKTLIGNPEAQRRIKLLKDMFSGRLIDESGQEIMI